ncbi:chemotaxis protein CheA [Ideonella sp.]|uniref:chemotaxis protein CheA n=1 Tax=Ideonella sp. TaxID=1929293 RepID=UPI0035B43419
MSAGTDLDLSFIAEALPAFISEAQEQIESLEQLLLQLEDRPDDRELLNALFRCAHTVKGSAGIFGLDLVVAFTHHVETLLDQLREGRLALTPALSTLLLQCNDQIRSLVERARDAAGDEDSDAATREALVQQLQAAAGTSPEAAPATEVQAAAAPSAVAHRWHVSVTFGPDTFRNGMDPLALLNYVRGLGEVPQIVCDIDAVPPLDQLDPESCHLGFEFGLVSEASRAEIEGAFSFVRDDCQLHVIQPGATPEHFAALIESMPDNPRLGEILVASGAITRAQLQLGLRTQAAAVAQGSTTRLGEVLQTVAGVSPQVVTAALNKQSKQRDGAAADDQRFIRVQADRLDAVINLLGELVIAGAGALLLARQTRQGALIEANDQISHLIEEIRNGTLQLRMVPIGETFNRFRRVVRDTACELGKDVQLEIVGAETELDKSVVERIADPLMHLVRNALDHGLESPEQREAAGKPRQGKLTLSACHESGSILIRIDDDGRGIQRQKVLQRAWAVGLVERGVVPPEAEIDQLIFEPGFSTASQVTNLSGRGVGMDVVRRNIQALRGSVEIQSTEGVGSRIEIRLPLTLAIIDGFLVGVGPSKFILPLESVVEVIESRAAPAQSDARGRSCVELRGQVLPVVSLRALYALDSPEPDRVSVVVIQAGGNRFGVMVDQLLGQHQTVIKPLGRMFRSLRGISGSSILGNGEVALIFDVPALGRLAAEARTSGRLAAEPSASVCHPAAVSTPAHSERTVRQVSSEGKAT